MQSAPRCCPCPSWVWVAPAMAAHEGSTGALPMQMYMPMTSQMMMPMSEHNGLLDSDIMGYANTAATVSQFTWSADGQLIYIGECFKDEAPQQLPMEATTPAARAEQSEFKEESVPSQVSMDVMTTAMASAAISAGTLRRRQNKTQWQSQMKSSPEFEGAHPYLEAETATECAKERYAEELANGYLTQLQGGGADRQMMQALFESLSFANEATSRAAQILLKNASSSDAAYLVKGLHGHVRNAVQSKNANYVLQTIIETMPVAHASFIVDELKGSGGRAARQQFGCRVLCRILEHVSPNDYNAPQLLDEIVNDDLQELCRHEFGSFVARHLLEFGFPHHKMAVVNALGTDLVGYSKDKFGSHVVEAALCHCSREEGQDLARQLLRNQDELLKLAGNQFGRHVVRALLDMHGEIKTEVVEVLLPMERRLKSMRYGKSVVQSLRAAVRSSVLGGAACQ